MIELDENQKAKIQHFLADKTMSEAVYQVIQNSFLAGRPTDVYVLAASRLALDYLRAGWLDLAKYRMGNEEKSNEIKQVGM